MELWQTISQESLDNLYQTEAWADLLKDSTAAIEVLQEQAGTSPKKYSKLRVRIGEFDVNEPILRAVYYSLLKASKPSAGLPKPYTRAGHLVLKQLAKDLWGLEGAEARDFTNSIAQIFRRYHLVSYYNRAGSLFWLREWPPTEKLAFLVHKEKAKVKAKPLIRPTAADAFEARRIEAVENNPAPVKVTKTFAALGLPKIINPKTMTEWAVKVVELGRAIEAERDQLLAERQAQEEGSWDDAAKAIAEALAGANGVPRVEVTIP